MKLGILSLICCFVIVQVYFACNTTNQNTFKTRKSIEILDMEVDKLGNYYMIDSENNIKKFDNKQNLLNSYSNNQFGIPAMIDVNNPHKILVFYKQQQTLVFLDNTLSEISIISLNPNFLYDAAGMANDGNIWLFDSYYYKLVKIDFKAEKIDESFPFEGINPSKISGNKIIERENYVMIVTNNNVIYLYNNSGYFIKKLHLPGIVKPTILNDKIYYFDKINNSYYSYDLKYNEKNLIYKFKKYKPSVVLYENNKFYALIKDKVVIIPPNERNY